MERVSNVLANVYHAIFGDRVQRKQTFSYWKQVKIAVVVVLIAAAIFFAYRLYVVHREKGAQKIFAECLDQYEHAVSGDASVSWPMVVDMWQHGYTMYSRSHLAPYFLTYKADSLAHDNKKEEAYVVMQQALAVMPVSSPVYYQYKIKEILMACELYNGGTLEGNQLVALKALAYDTKNPQRDEALYYVGLGYWVGNDLHQAAVAWKDLVDLSAASDSPSPWAHLVEDKVNQLADSGFLSYQMKDVELEMIEELPLETRSAQAA